MTGAGSAESKRCDLLLCRLEAADLRTRPWLVVSFSGVRSHGKDLIGGDCSPGRVVLPARVAEH